MDISANMKRYPKYKDSGVPWIESIPQTWKTRKLKHIFSEKKITHNTDLPCGSISFGKVVEKPDEKIPKSTKSSYQVLNRGEFLVNPLNLNYDVKSLRIALSELDVVVSSGYIVLRSKNQHKAYLNYMLHRYDVAHMKLLGSGVRQTISFNHIADSLLPLPTLPEQIAIASFLDDKVGKIDETIAQKEQLIQLLGERKQIIIQNAVTKGLNPNAPMKDSGIEWIGEIPEHWEVKKLKHSSKIRSGESIINTQLSDEGKFETYGGNGLMGYSNKWNHAEPAIIVGRVGAYCGNIRYSDQRRWISDNALILTSNLMEYEYLALLLKASTLNNLNESNAQPLITGTKVLNHSLPVPPQIERKLISKKIRSTSTKITQAIHQAQQSIKTLKEYKATLINSAVTGKIKIS